MPLKGESERGENGKEGQRWGSLGMEKDEPVCGWGLTEPAAAVEGQLYWEREGLRGGAEMVGG